MKLFERAGIGTTDAAGAAAVSFHEYVSDRSAALLLREQPGMLEIGSVVCVKIGDRYLAATAAHNVQHLDPARIEVVPAGERGAEALRVCRIICPSNMEDEDVACLELDPEECARAKAQAGPMSVVFLHGLVEATLGLNLPPEIQPVLDSYRRQHATYQPADARYLQMHSLHLLGVRPEEEKFLSPEFIAATTFTAAAPELRDRIRALGEGGYDQFVVQLVPGHESALEDWVQVFESV